MPKFKLTANQKEEIRRLTQLANRRIKTAEKQYREAGKVVAPREVVGHIQTRQQWHTKNTPLSRSVVFESQQDYERQLRFLRSFDPKERGYTKPTTTEYTQTQRTKTARALESSLGTTPPLSLLERVNKLNAAELSEFWKRFSDKASKLGIKYSSQQAMQETLNELYPEDIGQIAS